MLSWCWLLRVLRRGLLHRGLAMPRWRSLGSCSRVGIAGRSLRWLSQGRSGVGRHGRAERVQALRRSQAEPLPVGRRRGPSLSWRCGRWRGPARAVAGRPPWSGGALWRWCGGRLSGRSALTLACRRKRRSAGRAEFAGGLVLRSAARTLNHCGGLPAWEHRRSFNGGQAGCGPRVPGASLLAAGRLSGPSRPGRARPCPPGCAGKKAAIVGPPRATRRRCPGAGASGA